MGRSFSSELVLALRVLGVVVLVLTSSRVRFADSDGVDDDDGTGAGAGADRGARAGLGAGCIDFDCAFSVGGTVHCSPQPPSSALRSYISYRMQLFRVSSFEFRIRSRGACRANGDERARMLVQAVVWGTFRLGSGRGAAVRSGLVHAYVRDTGSTRPTAG